MHLEDLLVTKSWRVHSLSHNSQTNLNKAFCQTYAFFVQGKGVGTALLHRILHHGAEKKYVCFLLLHLGVKKALVTFLLSVCTCEQQIKHKGGSNRMGRIRLE